MQLTTSAKDWNSDKNNAMESSIWGKNKMSNNSKKICHSLKEKKHQISKKN